MPSFSGLEVSDVAQRFREGRETKEDTWDYITVPNNAVALKQKYDIEFGDEFVPTDTAMCDRLFQAGLEMFLNGIYDTATGRVAVFTEEEVREALACAPSEMSLGSDRDSVVCRCRGRSSSEAPVIVGGPNSTSISDKLHISVIESYAREPLVDVVIGGIVGLYNDRMITPGSLEEVLAVEDEIRTIRQACMRKGRGGMGILGPMASSSNMGRLAADLGYNAMRRSDLHYLRQQNEVKLNSDVLTSLAAWKVNGDRVISEHIPIMGGYVSTPEETAICDVASSIASFTVFGSDVHLDGPIHVSYGSTTTVPTLKVAGYAGTAMDRNTRCILGDQIFTMAGSCTGMCLLEIAAQAIVDTVSGRELLLGVGSAKGSRKDMASGMEARMIGEVAHAAAGMSIDDANVVVGEITSLYMKMVRSPPEGLRFRDCYNVADVTPNREYLNLHHNVRNQLRQCGLDI